MREQQAIIGEVISGPTELFVEVLSEMRSSPLQHDHHCREYGWHLYERDRDRREAAMREEVQRIIDRRNAHIEAKRAELSYLEAAE